MTVFKRRSVLNTDKERGISLSVWSDSVYPTQTPRYYASLNPAMAANVTDRVWSLEELVERTSDLGEGL